MASRGYLLLCFAALAACAQRPAESAPQPLVPKNGPEGNVRVEYEGGIFNRRLEALFNVKRPAYVMVAHLGGDGVIRVLFPEDARETGWIGNGRLYRTDIAQADYDAAPGYWFMRPTVFRTVGARSDSYDGNGHGFVFMIASSRPLDFGRVSEFGLWNEYESAEYVTTSDPRTVVREYANVVAPHGQYTLDYASNFSSWSSYSFANSQMDCAILSSGYGFRPWYATYSIMQGLGYYSMGFPSCRNASYFDYEYWDMVRRRNILIAMGPSANGPPPTTVPDTSIATPKPIAPRPGRRDPLKPTRDGTGTAIAAYRGTERGDRFTPDRRATPRGERAYPAPSTPWRGGRDARVGLTSPRSTRDLDRSHPSPRSAEPGTSRGGSSGGGSVSSRSGSQSTSRPRASPGGERPSVKDP